MLLTALPLLVTACESPEKRMQDGQAREPRSGGGAPFGGSEDVRHAQQLWQSDLADYRNWSSPAGLDGWQKGNSPHGKALKYYINDIMSKASRDAGHGAIIVKENYARKKGKLVAVTIMEKRRGYDPDNGDWFWVKYGPDGKVLKNPKGMKLAGRVAKGMNKGCIACHRNARGNDFIFYND